MLPPWRYMDFSKGLHFVKLLEMWIIYYSLNLAAFIPAKLLVIEGNVIDGEKRIIGFSH